MSYEELHKIRLEMETQHIKNQRLVDIEESHERADELLLEALKVLKKGTKLEIIREVDEIISVYKRIERYFS